MISRKIGVGESIFANAKTEKAADSCDISSCLEIYEKEFFNIDILKSNETDIKFLISMKCYGRGLFCLTFSKEIKDGRPVNDATRINTLKAGCVISIYQKELHCVNWHELCLMPLHVGWDFTIMLIINVCDYLISIQSQAIK